jgi:DNA polymerase III sliding clamp (beta) subunit (PCNA family)
MIITFNTAIFFSEYKKLDLFKTKSPCLNDNVMLCFDGESYFLYRSNGEISTLIEGIKPEQNDIPGINIAFNYKKMYETLKNCKARTFTMEVQESKIVVNTGMTTTGITLFPVDQYITSDVSLYTTKDKVPYTTKVVCTKLLTALKNVLPAASEDTTRASINSVLLNFDNDIIEVCATDTRRLGMETWKENKAYEKFPLQETILIRQETVEKMLKFFKGSIYTVEIGTQEKKTVFKSKNIYFEFKQEETFFPHVKQVIPNVSIKASFEFDTKEMQTFLKQVKKSIHDTSISVKIGLKQHMLELSYTDEEHNVSCSTVINCHANNFDIQFDSIRFNPIFLLEGLTDNDKTVLNLFDTEYSDRAPATLTSGQFLYVVMPMKK